MKRLEPESWRILALMAMAGVMILCVCAVKGKISTESFAIGTLILFPLSCLLFLVGHISEALEETPRPPLRKIALSELSPNSKFMREVQASREAEAAKHQAAMKRASLHQNPGPKTRRK